MNERLKVKDHTDCTHRVSRSAGDGPIYVAIRRTATEDHHSGSDIEVTASDGTKAYTKTLELKKYYAGNGYNVSWRMTENPHALPMTMEALTDGTIKVNNPRCPPRRWPKSATTACSPAAPA